MAENAQMEDDDFMGPGEELRQLHEDGQSISSRMKGFANNLQNQGERAAAEVMRQFIGEALEWQLEVVAAVGSHLEVMEERVGDLESGSGSLGIDDEDAQMFYRTFVVNLALLRLADSYATMEEKKAIAKGLGMTQDAMNRLIEITDDGLPQRATDVESDSGQTDSGQTDASEDGAPTAH